MKTARMATFFVIGLVGLTVAGCRNAPPPPGPKPAAPVAAARPAEPDSAAGFGEHHHPIRTSSAEAQKAFDLGMALAFGFHHEAAIRSFQRASELDPKAAMPHWGRAWALGPNYNLDIDDEREQQAFDAIQRAKMLSAEGPEDERAYIDAMSVRYTSNMKADRAALARAYSKTMGDLSHRYPDDDDAATLYAESLMNLTPWKLWTLDGRPAARTEEIVSVLETVLKRRPNHLGANHFYIHAVEASRTPERALASAMRLGTLVQTSGHLVHMPAHIYARTGDYAAAARANAGGAAADVKFLASAPPNGFYGMAYYPHNLHFLTDSQMMQGRFADAQQAAAKLRDVLAPHVEMMPMVESMIVMPVSVLLRFGRDEDVLALAEPPENRPVMRAWHHFARGVALARSGKPDEAAAERKALTAEIAKVPETALFGGSGFAPARSVLELAGTSLDARIAGARGEKPRSIQLWQQAVVAADKLPYDEPPVWFYPIRESLGAALLQSDRAVEAERVFRDDIARHPRNPRSLFGLRLSISRQGRNADAEWVQHQFDLAWTNADVKLTLADF